jgi:small GTP-binding protein
VATLGTNHKETLVGTLLKIIVTGPFNAGKTQFIETVSDIDVVTTERRITTEDRGIKAETTVAMDYGRMEIDGVTLHLNGTPGQARFDFMWEILATEMNGFIVLVDSTDHLSFADANELIALFHDFNDVPYLIAASKQDMQGALSINEVRRGVGAGDDVLVMPCVATQKTSVQQVLRQMIELVAS